MNILITTFSFPSFEQRHYDGKFVLAEAKAYANNGASVKVLTPHYPGSQKNEFPDERIEIIRFPYFYPYHWQRLKQPGKPIYDSKSVLALLQIPLLLALFSFHIIRLSKWTDIIHAQWTVTALLALPSKILFGKPIVMTARGSDLRLLPLWLNRIIFKSVTASIDCWGPQPTMVAYKEKCPGNSITLPLIVDYKPSNQMPADMYKYLDGQKDTFKIVYIGRLVQLKLEQCNLFLDLIDAASCLTDKLKFHIFFIGDGDDDILQTMEDKITLANTSHCVSLLGSKTDVADYIKHADVGIGGQALNAVSQEFIIAEVPQILAADDRNTEAIWTDKHNAFLVHRNQPKELANIISRLHSSPELQVEVTHNATHDMAQYVANTNSGGKQYLTAFKRIALLSHQDPAL
jgi:glycosyltransferase involved in cell wall biosynthesis